MKSPNSYHVEKLNVCISQEEKEEAKNLARERGMTFSGFMGTLVKEELRRAEKVQRRESV